MASDNLEPNMVCVKYLILIFNCVFVLTGILLIAVGSAITGLYANFDLLLDSGYISPATFLIAIGVIIFAVALFGVLGAAKESVCLINSYTACLVVIFIFEISAGFAGIAMQNSLANTLEANMVDAIKYRYVNSSNGMNETIDLIQSNLECCGANSPADWVGVFTDPSFNVMEGDIIVPNSCCGDAIINNTTMLCDTPYTEGCLPALTDVAKSAAILLTGAAIAVAVIQALGIFFSNSLAKAIRRAKSINAVRQIEIRNQLASSYEPMTKGEVGVPHPVIYLSGGAAQEMTA